MAGEFREQIPVAEASKASGISLDGPLPSEKEPLHRVEASHLGVIHYHRRPRHPAHLPYQIRPALHVRKKAEGQNQVEVAVGERQAQHVAAEEIKAPGWKEPVETGTTTLVAARHGEAIAVAHQRNRHLGMSSPHLQSPRSRPGSDEVKGSSGLDLQEVLADPPRKPPCVVLRGGLDVGGFGKWKAG